MIFRWLMLAVLGLAFGQLTACSGRPKAYPAGGRVTYEDGEPLKGGRIEVRSLEHPLVARGSIGNDGQFTLTTYKTDDGAVAGKHEVLIVQKFLADIDSMQEHAKHASMARTLDKKYSKYATSGLSVEVKRGADNQFTLQVTGE